MLSYSLEKKKGFENNKNVNFWKLKKWVFANGVNPWFRSRNPEFFLVLFFSKVGPEMMLSYGLERKERFEEDKNVSF